MRSTRGIKGLDLILARVGDILIEVVIKEEEV